jgi:hypothetical protein
MAASLAVLLWEIYMEMVLAKEDKTSRIRALDTRGVPQVVD